MGRVLSLKGWGVAPEQRSVVKSKLAAGKEGPDQLGNCLRPLLSWHLKEAGNVGLLVIACWTRKHGQAYLIGGSRRLHSQQPRRQILTAGAQLPRNLRGVAQVECLIERGLKAFHERVGIERVKTPKHAASLLEESLLDCLLTSCSLLSVGRLGHGRRRLLVDRGDRGGLQPSEAAGGL